MNWLLIMTNDQQFNHNTNINITNSYIMYVVYCTVGGITRDICAKMASNNWTQMMLYTQYTAAHVRTCCTVKFKLFIYAIRACATLSIYRIEI